MKCRKKRLARDFWKCFAECIGTKIGEKVVDDIIGNLCEKNFCRVFSNLPQCKKGNPCDIHNPDLVDCQNCCDIKWACCVANIKPRIGPGPWFDWNRCYAERIHCYANCN